MEVAAKDIQDLVLECARLREERDALLASVKERTARLVENEQRITAALLRANEDRCELNHERAKRAEAENERAALRLRLAEVERERDAAVAAERERCAKAEAELRAELARVVEQNGNLRTLFDETYERWVAQNNDALRLKRILEDFDKPGAPAPMEG